MKRISRRSFFRGRAGTPVSLPAMAMPTGAAAVDGTSRRAFLQGTAGAAAGAAVILATPKVAAVALDNGASTTTRPKATVTKPSGPAPHEPVTAYVRNPERGEVTVMAGKQETTYRDPVLVKRLLDAAR
jgi:hypothetical protein